MARRWNLIAASVAASALAASVGCSRRHDPSPPAPAAKEAPTATTLSAAVATAAPPPEPRARPLAGKKVLHVGDSMVGGAWGLTRALDAKLSAEGAKLIHHTKVSESLTSFDKSSTLRDLLRAHEPDIVIINLGANDALVPHPEVFVKSVQNIVRRVGDRECWWIGPPMWKKDTGIVDVIRDNVGSCHFFDSSDLELDRASDGIHPNERGAAKWADAFFGVFVALPEGPATSR
jgi:lysophospholipase L1-like esterase